MAINIRNLDACIRDIRAALSSPTAPPISFDHYVNDYSMLLQDLRVSQTHLPFAYQDGVVIPFISYLRRLGDAYFYEIFKTPDPQLTEHEKFLKQIIPDISLAILIVNSNTDRLAAFAFQEVVSDLYDGFLSEEDRAGKITGRPINPPDRGTLAPLIKWGNPESGPYTWPISATSLLGLKAAIVSLPPAYIGRGLFAWSTLGHETGGHDILHADTGLIQELGRRVYNAVYNELKFIANEATSKALANYWVNCVDETASDVLGILNIGPAAGIGLVGYFKGLMGGRLRNYGPLKGPHPVDILRAFVAAEVVRRLSFRLGMEWSETIERTALGDLADRKIYLLEGNRRYAIDPSLAIRTARIAARVITNNPINALEGHALIEIQDWTEHDEEIANAIGNCLIREGTNLPQDYRGSGFYAAHVVAAATVEALKEGANIMAIFNQMKRFLAVMHEDNISWERLIFTIRDLGLRYEPEPAPFEPETTGIPAEFK